MDENKREAMPRRTRRRDQAIECPLCRCYQCPTTCTRTHVGFVLRYRKCAQCGWSFTTREPTNGPERVAG